MNKFSSINELYNFYGYFWQYGRCLLNLQLVKTNGKPYLLNKNTNEQIKGLANINRYIKFNDIVIENL